MRFLLLFGVLLGLLATLARLRGRWRRVRERRQRILIEDALKHVHSAELKGSLATPESLAGALGLRVAAALALIATMESEGLVRATGGGLVLTASGRQNAVRVIRAHRLLERHFADELGMPLEAVHGAADRQEHMLTTEQAAEIEARLGYPRRDPHGDPIPQADGSLAVLGGGVALTEQPVGQAGVILHVEDEPPELFRQIAAAGFHPGARVEVLERTPEQIVVRDGERESVLTPLAAANVLVAPLPQPVASGVRLTALAAGKRGRVVALHCSGLERRRLLDLGVTPGATVERTMTSPLGDPTAYRVRGALIALREAQANRIEIEPLDHAA